MEKELSYLVQRFEALAYEIEISESLVKAYFTLWLLIASLQVLGSVGLFIVFQQRSVALDISFAFSLIRRTGLSIPGQNLGKYDQAVEMFNRRINFAPELREPYFYRGMAFAYSGNIEAAFADFATYLGLPPGSPEKYILTRIMGELPEEVILLLEGQNGGL